MSEVTTQVESLEQQKSDLLELLERRNQALKLAKNTEFRKLILEGFCLKEAARYVQESGDPFLTPDQRADALNIAQASGHLKRFLSLAIQMGSHAERSLKDLDVALEEARSEELDL